MYVINPCSLSRRGSIALNHRYAAAQLVKPAMVQLVARSLRSGRSLIIRKRLPSGATSQEAA